MTGSVRIDSLFAGLTRPALFLGVSYNYALLNGMICSVYFINYTNFLAVLIMIVIHMIGYLVSYHEPRFLEILMMRAQKFSICKNKLLHGANSYDTY